MMEKFGQQPATEAERGEMSLEEREAAYEEFVQVAHGSLVVGGSPFQKLLDQVKGQTQDGSKLDHALVLVVMNTLVKLTNLHRKALGLPEYNITNLIQLDEE